MSKERVFAYVQRLYAVRDKLQERLQEENKEGKNAGKLSGAGFEKLVYDALLEAGFAEDAITHSAQKFPDFVIEDREGGERIGVEVKKTDASKWEVIGGSVYESLRNDIDDTYVLMAKMGGGQPEVRLRRYKECIADLKVTHSPRFYLNLDLPEGEDYLTQNDAKDLLELSGDELNRKIRQLLRTQKSTWWSEGETVAFSDLPQSEKGSYLNEGIALFPEVFRGDYRKFTPWLVYHCFVWCGNVRDIFSSGGNKFLEEMGIYVSAVMYRAWVNSGSIRQRILEMTVEEQQKCWGKTPHTPKMRIEAWVSMVEENLKLSSELIKNNKRLQQFEGCADAEVRMAIIGIYIRCLRERMERG